MCGGRIVNPVCDHCASTEAVIYCESDSAKLCLFCDGQIHSANPLSLKHARSLICEKCFSQPSVIRCLYERVSYCQDCYWKTSKCFVFGHQIEILNLFSGCPTPIEFYRMWSSFLEPTGFGLVNPFLSPLPLNDPNNAMFEIPTTNELEGLMWPHTSNTQNLSDQSTVLSKECPDLKLEEGVEDLYEGLNLDNAPLFFNVGDDIIKGSPQEHIESDHAVPNCLFIDMTSTSVTASNFTIDNTLEGSSPSKQDCTSYHSGPQQININNGLPLQLPTSPVFLGPIHPTMSLTTGESSAADYQDCGMSPEFIMSETPWESNLDVSSPQARNQAKLRYKEKKLKRSFGKQIRYASRKARADTRKRVKGRFVKAGDIYDYDPSSPPTTSNE